MSQAIDDPDPTPGLLRRYWRKRRNWRLFLPRRVKLYAIPGAAVQGYFNATLLASDEEKLTLICRKAYYGLSAKGQMMEAADAARTQNFSVELLWKDGRFELGPTRWLEGLDGLEDIRIFRNLQHRFFFAVEIFSKAQTAEHAARPRSAPVAGVVSLRGEQVAIQRMRIPDPTHRVEKNWVYFQNDDQLLIEKSPGLSDLYVVDPIALTLARVGRQTAPLFWSGTKAISWNGGTLFLDHRRVKLHELARIKIRYVYRFRHHVNGTVRHSRDFSMGSRASVTYVSDLQRAGDLSSHLGEGVVLSVSTNDTAFSLFRIPSADLARLLRSP